MHIKSMLVEFTLSLRASSKCTCLEYACRVDNMFQGNIYRHYCSNKGENVNCFGLLSRQVSHCSKETSQGLTYSR